MSDVPVQLIVAAFQDEQGAGQALKELKRLKREKLVGIQNAAVLRKDAKGKIHIKETADMGGGKGAALGGVAGAAIGVLAGPALLVPAAVGALIGGLAAKSSDSGFKDSRLQTIGEGLKPGSSAIVAVVEHRWVETVRQELAEERADIFAQALSGDIAEQLEREHDVAYSALATQGAFAVGRVSVGAEEAEGGMLIASEEGISESQFVATKEGIAVHSLTVDDEGITEIVAVATPVDAEPAAAETADASSEGDGGTGSTGGEGAAASADAAGSAGSGGA